MLRSIFQIKILRSTSKRKISRDKYSSKLNKKHSFDELESKFNFGKSDRIFQSIMLSSTVLYTDFFISAGLFYEWNALPAIIFQIPIFYMLKWIIRYIWNYNEYRIYDIEDLKAIRDSE